MASWEKTPISLIGVRESSFRGSFGSTSKTYPCGFKVVMPSSSLRPCEVASSQVNHVPQGVEPSAQLETVPAELTKLCTSRRLLSTTTTVVPPKTSVL